MVAAASDIIFNKTSENTSAGGTDSGVPISTTRNSFFPAIADVDRLAGGSRIKKWCAFNNHATDDWTNPSYYLAEGTDITEELGLGYDHGDDDDNDQGNMTAWTTNALVDVRSDGADTRQVTFTGLDGSGVVASETLTLNGTTHVVGAQTFSVVYGAIVDSQSSTRTITIKQGSNGTTRGTIGTDRKVCWLWVAAISEGAGILLDDLAAQSSHCMWHRQTWAASTPGHRPDTTTLFTVDH